MKKKNKNARSKSSASWLNEHVNDHYVHLAKKDGYRARAAYKLLEINEKDNLLKPGLKVVDLGSAPGSWSQVAIRKMQNKGMLVALDILEMEPIEGVHFIQGDFTELSVLETLETYLNNDKLDLVISDIAPNITGMAIIDQAKSYYLAELALDFSKNHLKENGRFLVKVFQGSGYQEYLKLVKSYFKDVVVRKPQASRDRSTELYLLASNLR
ncbi:23S rRNA methyltransferase [Neisseriaceae bacterium PsAf]|nr:23S rRNA methyltransferase [Neisseriaceae bacterium PsAf]MCV2503295.1 RlmE family RNA methyltransferase [Neisseriaceae bacterium]